MVALGWLCGGLGWPCAPNANVVIAYTYFVLMFKNHSMNSKVVSEQHT